MKAEVLVSSLYYFESWWSLIRWCDTFQDEEFADQKPESVRQTKRRTITWNKPRLRTDSVCSVIMDENSTVPQVQKSHTSQARQDKKVEEQERAVTIMDMIPALVSISSALAAGSSGALFSEPKYVRLEGHWKAGTPMKRPYNPKKTSVQLGNTGHAIPRTRSVIYALGCIYRMYCTIRCIVVYHIDNLARPWEN